MSNESIDKLAETYTSDEDDTKAYLKAQAATVINQTRQINDLRKKIEEMVGQIESLTIENTRLKTLSPDIEKDSSVSDAETLCLVQLALLNSYSMQRELSLEEIKKMEICAKVLLAFRGKQEKKEVDTVGSLSNEQLLEAMKSM
jgi:regulator of replication initiation timing